MTAEEFEAIKEKKLYVPVKIRCRYCGAKKRGKALLGSMSTRCPGCDINLFNKYATGEFGEVDNEGYYYHANERLISKRQREEQKEMAIYAEMFGVE